MPSYLVQRVMTLDGIRYISSDEFVLTGIPAGIGAFWVDHVLWDIPNTLIGACRNAHAAGARAVTLHENVVRLASFRSVVNACKALGLIIVVAVGPQFERRVYWRPKV